MTTAQRTPRASALAEAHSFYVDNEYGADEIANLSDWAQYGFTPEEVGTGTEGYHQERKQAKGHHLTAIQTGRAELKAVNESELTSEQATEEAVRRLAQNRIRNGAWLNRQEFAPLQWSVPGILPEGYCMIVAPPKAGKSWFVANIGLSCAAGGTTLGALDVDFRPVLYFALEDGDRRLQDRFRKLEGRDHIPEAMHRVLEVRDLNELIIISEHFQDESEEPPLIIVDTLGKVNPGRKASESQYDADYGVGSRLQNLAKRVPGTTVLAVHHTNKGEHSDFLNAVSGTQGVTGACDAVLVLQRSRKSDDAVLAITGRDIENETEYAITSDNGKWLLKGGSLQAAEDAAQEVKAEQAEAAQAAKYGDRSSAVLAAVNALRDEVGKESITPKEIAEEFGIDNRQAGNTLARLEKKGLIIKAGRGSYKPVPEVGGTGWIVNDSFAP